LFELPTSINKAAAAAVFFLAGGAHSACVVPAIGTPLEEQLAMVPDCQRNAPFLAQIGRLLIAQGRYADALDHLERAIMFEPDMAAAQLDYAIALAGSGDMLSARQLLDNIIAQPETTPELRKALIQAKQRLPRPAGLLPVPVASEGPLTVQLGANLRSGHDSNLLGAPSLTSLELTFPGEVIELPLTENNFPRPGAYTRAEAKLELSYQNADGGRWGLAANLMQRNSPAVPEANTRQSEIALEYSPPMSNGSGAYWSASHVNLNNDSGTQYTSQGVVMGLQSRAHITQARSICTARAGLDWQDRQLTSNPILSGRYTGLASVWSCNTPGGGQWQVSAKAGHDRPADLTRPGGEQTIANLRAFASTGTVLVDLEISRAQDATGYSPLLDNNAVRHTTRLNARLEYQHQLNQRLLGTLGAEWSNQQSNLPLFRLQSWGPYAAIRYVW
jgi:tetratricopeptide (TPR) repeat protein